MQVIETAIPEVILFQPRKFDDPRGYFFESFNKETFAAIGITQNFVQDNQSKSTRGVLRGLHYQTGEHAQAKLVRVLEGEVLDVAVDIRKGSPTYGKHVAAILSAENNRQMLVPRGFAHGFVVLSPTATFFYKCDNLYNKESEGGIIWDDPAIGIDWKINLDEVLLSEKDAIMPTLDQCRNDFEYKK
jgi:dTDP-4-dehydrorhamnose 3,5-epimerase